MKNGLVKTIVLIMGLSVLTNCLTPRFNRYKIESDTAERNLILATAIKANEAEVNKDYRGFSITLKDNPDSVKNEYRDVYNLICETADKDHNSFISDSESSDYLVSAIYG